MPELRRPASRRTGSSPGDAGFYGAALPVTLVPGLYSAQVSGVRETTGVAQLEVYEVP